MQLVVNDTADISLFFEYAQGPQGLPGPKGETGPAGTTSWTGITDKPTTLAGYGITDAANTATTVEQSDIGTGPNEIPLNQHLGDMAFQSRKAVVIEPAASVTPHQAGSMVFQLTSDTQLVVKVKGSDGTVRSATLTLA